MQGRKLKSVTKTARTCVYRCNYHVVFSTKDRNKFLTEEVAECLKTIIYQIAKQKGFEVSQVEVKDQDHVHIFVSAHPKFSPSHITKVIKGVTAKQILVRFPHIRERLSKGHVWGNSYYVETLGTVSDRAIHNYMEAQKKKTA